MLFASLILRAHDETLPARRLITAPTGSTGCAAPVRRASLRSAAWLAAGGALLIAGCEGAMAPNAPPSGAQINKPAAAKPALAAPVAEPRLASAWLGTRTWTEREVSIDALRRIGPAALPALVDLLHGPDADVRQLAARAIALMGPAAKAAVPDLLAGLSDLDPAVRKNVIRALGQVGPGAETAIPALVDEIQKPGPLVEPPRPTSPGTSGALPVPGLTP